MITRDEKIDWNRSLLAVALECICKECLMGLAQWNMCLHTSLHMSRVIIFCSCSQQTAADRRSLFILSPGERAAPLSSFTHCAGYSGSLLMMNQKHRGLLLAPSANNVRPIRPSWSWTKEVSGPIKRKEKQKTGKLKWGGYLPNTACCPPHTSLATWEQNEQHRHKGTLGWPRQAYKRRR